MGVQPCGYYVQGLREAHAKFAHQKSGIWIREFDRNDNVPCPRESPVIVEAKCLLRSQREATGVGTTKTTKESLLHFSLMNTCCRSWPLSEIDLRTVA